MTLLVCPPAYGGKAHCTLYSLYNVHISVTNNYGFAIMGACTVWLKEAFIEESNLILDIDGGWLKGGGVVYFW